MKQQIILEVKGVNKSFPGVKALDNVSMEVRRGEVHALLGENGAGKSTLMKILAGVYQPDSGEIFIRGRKVVLDNPLLKNTTAFSKNQVIYLDASSYLASGGYHQLMAELELLTQAFKGSK